MQVDLCPTWPDMPANYALAIAEVQRLRQREIELLRRAYAAEAALDERVLQHDIERKSLTQDRNNWRTRWERAQEQVGRWFKLSGNK